MHIAFNITNVDSMADDDNILKRLIKEKQAMQRATMLSPANTDTEKLQKILALRAHKRDIEKATRRMMVDPDDWQTAKKLLDLENEKLQRIEERIAELARSMNPVTLEMLAPKMNELDDKQLIKYAEDFLKLPQEEQAKLFLGRGAFKNTFDLPGTNYVLKTPTGLESYIPKDYIQNRIIREEAQKFSKNPEFIQNIVEQPMLVRVPESNKEVLIQKKLIPIADVNYDHYIDYDKLEASKKYEDYIKEIDKIFPYENARPQDLSRANVGIDPKTGEVKAFDAMVSPSKKAQSIFRTEELIKKLKELSDPTLLKGLADSDFGKASVKLLPILGGAAAFTAKKMLPIVGFGGSFQEAKEEGMSTPEALVYALSEEANPTPISGIDFYKGMEKAAEGRRKNLESMYMPKEMKAKQEFLENYAKSDMAKDKAYGTLRKILKDDVDEELVKKLLPKRVVTPFKPED